MIAQADLPALYLQGRSARFIGFCWQPISLVAARHGHFGFSLTLGASALVGVLVTSAMIEKTAVGRQEAKLETTRLATVRNETIVYRREPQPNADQDYLGHPYTEQIEVSDQLEDEDTPSNFPRTVQTVRFVNPDALAGIGRVTSAPSEFILRGPED